MSKICSGNLFFILRGASIMLLAMFFFCGCSESDERRHPLFLKAVKARNNGEAAQAAETFKELIRRRPKSVYVHLELAGVYDEMLNDPLSALFHYRTYLEAMPDAPDAAEVKAWITQAEKRSYELLKERFEPAPLPSVPAAAPQTATVPGPETATLVQEKAAAPIPEPAPVPPRSAPAVDAAEYAELKQLLSQYQARHRYMLAELQRLRKLNNVPQPNAAGRSPQAPAGSTNAPGTYKVLPGDTPGKIARKLYGKSSLYKVILQANPAVNERNLRPGMILNIPEKPSR